MGRQEGDDSIVINQSEERQQRPIEESPARHTLEHAIAMMRRLIGLFSVLRCGLAGPITIPDTTAMSLEVS